MPETSVKSQSKGRLIVVGGGPGGYSAAFRAADLGFEVILVERYPVLGGVCLNVGCIPSKALLHTTAVIREALALKEQGISFNTPEIKPEAMMQFKDSVISRLNRELTKLAEQRRISVIHDTAVFSSEHELKLEKSQQTIGFDKAIIASGSRNRRLEGIADDLHIMYSSDSLDITNIPKSLLIIGGGVIGSESAFIYQGLGCEVTVAEIQPRLFQICDVDISKPLINRLNDICDTVYTQAQLGKLERDKTDTTQLLVEIKTSEGIVSRRFDAVLVCAGRLPNSDRLGLDVINLLTDDKSFIVVDECLRTNLPDIYAVGDVIGEPMLAHKASYQGKIAAEHAAGMRVCFDNQTIPSVIYSDPELAWVGLTEQQARESGMNYRCAIFPWQASGRALSTNRSDGLTKLIYNPETKLLLGGAICGANAGELIAEITLAIEMNTDLYDIASSIHPHPTYSETIAQTAELALGTITELYVGKGKSPKL